MFGPNDEEFTTMKKILILECDDALFSHRFAVDVPYDCENRELDLGYCLHRLLFDILDSHQQYQVFYFHPIHHYFAYAGVFPLKFSLIIDEDFIQSEQITIKLRKVVPNNQEVQQQQLKLEKSKELKKRVAERTIREVLEKVSEWREISLNNPKIHLGEAAKFVDIPKKTLDDYFSAIKVASANGFNFQSNLDQKIGVLRKFVRDHHLKRKNSNDLQFMDAIMRKQSQQIKEDEEQEDDNKEEEQEQEEEEE